MNEFTNSIRLVAGILPPHQPRTDGDPPGAGGPMTASSAATVPSQVELDVPDRPRTPGSTSPRRAAPTPPPTSSSSAPARPARPPPSALARSGVDVLLLEKSTFPRDKVCGDGLTPRGVKQVLALGVDVSGADWIQNKGLRVVGARPLASSCRGRRCRTSRTSGWSGRAATSTTCWPRWPSRPVPGCASAPRSPNRCATSATGRITGVTAKTADGPVQLPRPAGARLRRGVSAKVALGMGINKRDDRPLGVAVRRYYRSPARTDDDYLESHLELWDRTDPAKAQAAARLRLDLRARRRHGERRPRHAQLVEGVRPAPTIGRCCGPGWTAPRRNGGCARRTRSARSAAPACRWASTAPRTTPTACCWSATPAASVNPFNGEGIAYAMESAAIAAEAVLQALGRPEGESREAALHGYVTRDAGAPRRVLPAGRHLLHADRQAGRS